MKQPHRLVGEPIEENNPKKGDNRTLVEKVRLAIKPFQGVLAEIVDDSEEYLNDLPGLIESLNTILDQEVNKVGDKVHAGGHAFRVVHISHHVLIAEFMEPHKTSEFGHCAYGWDKENSGDYEKPEEPPNASS